MRQKIRVAPKDEKSVLRDPKTMERITAKGKVVYKDAYWIRRLKAGDCLIIKEAPAVAKVQLKEGKAKK